MAEVDPGLEELSHADDGHGGIASVSRFRCLELRQARLEPGDPSSRHRHPSHPAGSKEWRGHRSGSGPNRPYSGPVPDVSEPLSALAEQIRAAAWDLAVEVVDEGLREDAVPSLQRLGQVGQLGDMPTFIVELSKELAEPQPGRMRRGGPLAGLVRDHARERESLGFAPREIVTELLVLRRVLWRFVSSRAHDLTGSEVFEAERRLNDSLDVLVAECVVAYFDRATAELADQARRDPLTELLNYAAFGVGVEEELDRARRYERGLTLVYVDVDEFKSINDEFGHPEGDRVLRRVAALLTESLRGSDLAGRLGGDEFAVCLIESDLETGGRFLARLQDLIDEEATSGRLPEGLALSAGLALYPQDAVSSDALFRLADERLYEAKRAKAAG
jgi:diguanylate cyclase (GGDEF)-like protein